MADNKHLACFVLFFLLASAMAVDAQSGNACIPVGANCNRNDRSRSCCGNAVCQPEFVCVTDPCPAPWICQ